MSGSIYWGLVSDPPALDAGEGGGGGGVGEYDTLCFISETSSPIDPAAPIVATLSRVLRRASSSRGYCLGGARGCTPTARMLRCDDVNCWALAIL